MAEVVHACFRDLKHGDNLLDGKTHHSAGVVDGRYNTASVSGKDLSVMYFDPFKMEVVTCWRGDNEVELFFVGEEEWADNKRRLELISTVLDADIDGLVPTYVKPIKTGK